MQTIALLVIVLVAMTGAQAQPEARCTAQLTAFCNDLSVPVVQECYQAMRNANDTFPLVALYDTDESHGPDLWRCYSPKVLNANQTKYIGGDGYCSLAILPQLYEDCLYNFTATEVVFPFNTAGVYAYRIPVMVHVPAIKTSPTPVLLAFAEARVYSLSDSGPKCVSMRQSYDNGQTWGQIVNLACDPMNNPDLDGTNMGAAVYDPTTQAVHLIYYFGFHSLRVAPTYVITSYDGGNTWSSYINITESLYASNVWAFAAGPGTGVYHAESGRLIVAGWYRDAAYPAETGSIVIISDDHGLTWRAGGSVQSPGGPNESQVTLLSNGSLLINMRNAYNNVCSCRLQAISLDAGDTFEPAYYVPELTDPVCQGSIITGFDDSTIYFSNADNSEGRINGTIHVSYDSGATYEFLAMVDPGAFGYSAITQVNSTSLGVLYESQVGNSMTIRYSVKSSQPTGTSP